MIWDILTLGGFVRDYWPWVLGTLAALVSVLALAWILRSWKLLLEALAGLAVALTATSVYRRGAEQERRRKAALEERAIARTREVQERVDGMSDAEVSEKLNRWIPKP